MQQACSPGSSSVGVTSQGTSHAHGNKGTGGHRSRYRRSFGPKLRLRLPSEPLTPAPLRRSVPPTAMSTLQSHTWLTTTPTSTPGAVPRVTNHRRRTRAQFTSCPPFSIVLDSISLERQVMMGLGQGGMKRMISGAGGLDGNAEELIGLHGFDSQNKSQPYLSNISSRDIPHPLVTNPASRARRLTTVARSPSGSPNRPRPGRAMPCRLYPRSMHVCCGLQVRAGMIWSPRAQAAVSVTHSISCACLSPEA